MFRVDLNLKNLQLTTQFALINHQPMKLNLMKQLIGLFFIVASSQLFGQKLADKYIDEGIAYHDQGEYTLAVESYQHALYLNDSSSLAHYELAMTYMYMEEYDSSLAHSNKVIDLNNGHLLPAYLIKANNLDALGKSNEAIKVYQYILKNFKEDHMVYYNLALTQSNLGRTEEAIDNLIKGINLYQMHPSSHLLLGNLLNAAENKVQSILSLHFFLLLEPNSQRSADALELLKEQLAGNAEQTGENSMNIILNPAALDKKNEFGSAEVMLSMLAATNMTAKKEGASDMELFISNNNSIFKILGELKKKKNKGLWWEFYIPFYYDLAKSKHLDTYCRYISQSESTEAGEWIYTHEKELAAFDEWLSK